MPRADGQPAPRFRRGWIASVAFGFCLVGLNAMDSPGAPITYAFGGTVASANSGAGVTPGTRFSGSISFDPDGPVAVVPDPRFDTITYYKYGTAGGFSDANPTDVGMSLTVDGQPVESMRGGLVVTVIRGQTFTQEGDETREQASVLFSPTEYVPDSDQYRMMVELDTPDISTVADFDGLPTSLDPAAFPFGTFLVFDIIQPPIPQTYDSRSYWGRLDGFEIVSTPEPSTAALFGLGVVGWLIRPRRRPPAA